MPDFGELGDKAKDMADDHEKQVEGGMDKAGDAAGDKFGHADQIDTGVDKAKDHIGDEN